MQPHPITIAKLSGASFSGVSLLKKLISGLVAYILHCFNYKISFLLWTWRQTQIVSSLDSSRINLVNSLVSLLQY